jgi:hypothetical protein
VADTLDEAKAAFRAAWERPLFLEKANEIWLSLNLSAHDPKPVIGEHVTHP